MARVNAMRRKSRKCGNKDCTVMLRHPKRKFCNRTCYRLFMIDESAKICKGCKKTFHTIGFRLGTYSGKTFCEACWAARRPIMTCKRCKTQFYTHLYRTDGYTGRIYCEPCWAIVHPPPTLLDSRDKNVIPLVDKYGYRTAARCLGVSTGTIAGYMHRYRKRVIDKAKQNA